MGFGATKIVTIEGSLEEAGIGDKMASTGPFAQTVANKVQKMVDRVGSRYDSPRAVYSEGRDSSLVTCDEAVPYSECWSLRHYIPSIAMHAPPLQPAQANSQ